jgi:hypothetical protein
MADRTTGLSVIRFSVVPGVARTRATTKAALRCESLEDRRLLSIGVGAPGSIGMGPVAGGTTSGPESAEISPLGGNDPGMLATSGGSLGGHGNAGLVASPTTPNLPGGSSWGLANHTVGSSASPVGMSGGQAISHAGPQGLASSGGQQAVPGGLPTTMPFLNASGKMSGPATGSPLAGPAGGSGGAGNLAMTPSWNAPGTRGHSSGSTTGSQGGLPTSLPFLNASGKTGGPSDLNPGMLGASSLGQFSPGRLGSSSSATLSNSPPGNPLTPLS